MTPNLTVGYMAAQAKMDSLSRKAELGWMAEEAANSRKSRGHGAVERLNHLIGVTFDRSSLLVRRAFGSHLVSQAVNPRMDQTV